MYSLGNVTHALVIDMWLHLLVAVALSLDLPEYVDPVVVPQRPRHLVVVHGEVVLLDAPQLGQARRVDDLEHAGVLVLPRDVGGVAPGGVVEQLLQKVPQEAAVRVQLGRLAVLWNWGKRKELKIGERTCK